MLYTTIFAWQFVWPAEVRLLGLLQKYYCPEWSECAFFRWGYNRFQSISNYLKQCTSDTISSIQHSKPLDRIPWCFSDLSSTFQAIQPIQGDPPIQDLINNECANALADGGGLKVRVVSEAPTVPWWFNSVEPRDFGQKWWTFST